MKTTHGRTIERVVTRGNVTETVVRTVADATGRDPFELDPLYGAIDPDALEQLVTSTGEAGVDVTFVWEGCDVYVDSGGTVRVVPRDDVTGKVGGITAGDR